MSDGGPSPELHRLLQRQLRRLGLRPGTAPDADTWDRLLERVSQTYAEADDERYLMERSVSLASTEMASLNEALRRSRDSAEALASVKSTFLANMSHEIRTPLNAVLGMAYLALQADPSPRQREYLGKIRQAGQHLLGIINDILDFSKIEAGRLQVEQIAFDLDQALESVVSMVADRARAKGLALSLEVGDRVPARLLGDPQKLRQILINYLNNAVKFTERGGVTLRVSAGPADDSGGLPMRFEVRDTGIGVAPDEVDRIFHSFEQADASTTRRFGGTGLGLAISRRLAGLMGGEVGVVSEPGVGSTFWLELRLVRAPADEGVVAESATAGYLVRVVDDRLLDQARSGTPPVPPPEGVAETRGAPARLSGARVLLVEDNELNQQVASELLHALGVQVDVAPDGRAAVERLRQSGGSRYALVLMDVHMPVMDGLEATRMLRSLKEFATIPVVAMTASVLPEECERVLEVGMNALLPKPVDPSELEACLLRWIPGAAAPGEVRGADRESAMSPAGTALPSVDGLDVTTGLRRCGGDSRFYLRMLTEFVSRWSDFGARARRLVACSDRERLHREAHTLKGICGTIGASRLQHRAMRVEDLARAMPDANVGVDPQPAGDGSNGPLTEAIDALDAELRGVAAALAAQLRLSDSPQPETSGAVSLEPDELGRALALAREALELLEASELVVVQHFEAERALFRAWMDPEGFAALERALRDYDLEGAAAVLGAALESLASVRR